MEYRFLRQSDETLSDLCYLFRIVHHRHLPESYFKKKYDTGWTGKKYLGYIAYNEKREPVASYAVLPCYLLYRQQKILVAQAVDATTHPAHRKRGLFVTLAQKTHQLAKEEGVLYVFSFPNANSYHGFTQRLHFLHPEDAVQYTIPVKTLPLIKAANKYKWFSAMYGIYFRAIMRLFFRKGGLVIPNSVTEDNVPGIEHDADYFSHKSYEKNYRLKTGKFRIWFKLDDGILAGDVSRFHENDFKDFIGNVKRMCRLLGSHQFRVSASPDTFIDRMFRGKFQSNKAFPVTYLDLGVSKMLPPETVKFVMADSDTF
ncbi:MAG TPA: GNAT family N-acetyltransferase [Chitinophagales bacterium]|nr:GNAT family N-acetyltransferase [Chitinophagales bacterium]